MGRIALFCGVPDWRRAGGRCGRFSFLWRLRLAAGGRARDAGGFHFLRRFGVVCGLRRSGDFFDVCVGVSGVRFARFAVFAFSGGRAFFTIQSPNLRATALLEKRCPRVCMLLI